MRSVASLKNRVARAVQKRVFRHYCLPYSDSGLEPLLVRHFRSSRRICLVDVGASTGSFTAQVEEAYGLERALLVEPIPQRADELRRHFKEPIVQVVNAAVGDRDGEIMMSVLNWDYSSSILPVDRSLQNVALDLDVRETIRTRLVRLDSVLAEHNWTNNIDLLKLDVQGAELMVLAGAKRALESTTYVLTEISFRPMYKGSAVFSDVYEFLQGHDFALISISEGFRGSDGELFQGDALFKRRDTWL
jgi:FkbM family methyltransferase